jgi:TonB family protein
MPEQLALRGDAVRAGSTERRATHRPSGAGSPKRRAQPQPSADPRGAHALSLLILLAIGVAFHSSRALAQTNDAGGAPSGLVAPILLRGDAQPVYPEGQRVAASVALELTLDRAGVVGAVAVTRSAGPAFDDAARAFARTLSFSPALRDGQPIPALIPFTVEFTPPAPPGQSPGSGPVAAHPASAADATGSGSAAGSAPPPLTAAGHSTAPGASVAEAPQAAAPPLIGTLELEVRGAPPLREATRRSLEAEQVRIIPGTNGDVLRSVETLPGVARPSPLDGVLAVRGAAPNDTQVFVDGTPIPLAYHFGGISSVIPGDVLDRLDFYPGNFGAQFGRGMGGVIDVGLRSPRRDRFAGLLQVDALDGRLRLEAPLGPHTRFLIAARRSWVDAWLGPALDGADVAVRGAPVYWDGQLVLEQDLGSRSRARLAVFGSDDSFAILIKSPNPSDPAQGGRLSSTSRWLRAQLRLESQLSEHIQWNNMLSYGYTDSNALFGNDYFRYDLHEINGRSELRARLAPCLSWTGGLDFSYARYDVDLLLAPYPGDNAAPGPYFARPSRAIQAIAPLMRPALYTGFELTPVPALRILPSLRADYTGDTGDVTLAPRLSARWDVLRSPRRTTLKGGFGSYYQPPQPQESVKPVGSETIRSSRALHASLGVEQELGPGFDVSLEGFYKWLDDLVVARADESRLIGARFENSGEGRAFGAEFMLRYRPSGGRLSGWIAYTLSRSQRRDNGGDAYYIFAWDQTHILSAVANLDLGRGWTLGARFRYVTGNPFTPHAGGVVDLDAGAYAALSSPHPNSGRLGAFHQLDLRVEKLWQFELWRLAAYLELRNVYNRENPEGVTYNYDYSRRQTVAGLPILPVLGLRGEL